MMAGGCYLLRTDDAAQAKLDLIAEGTGIADLIDDLGKLAGLVEAHQKVFAAAKFPKDSPKQARALAQQLLDGPGDAHAIDLQGRRNQMVILLEQQVEELRSAARYLYQDDPKKLALYLSQYGANKMRRLRSKSGAPTPPEPP